MPVLTSWLEQYGAWGYLFVFLTSTFESLAFIGLIVPGGNFAMVVGILCSYDFFGFWRMVWMSTIGAIIGDILSFYLGKWSTRFFKPDSRWLNSKYLERGEEFFIKHGGKSVFLGRFVGPIRPIIPFVAGMFSMSFWRFMVYNALSAFIWSVYFLGIGYWGGEYWKILPGWTERSVLFLIPLISVLVAWVVLKKRKKETE